MSNELISLFSVLCNNYNKIYVQFPRTPMRRHCFPTKSKPEQPPTVPKVAGTRRSGGERARKRARGPAPAQLDAAKIWIRTTRTSPGHYRDEQGKAGGTGLHPRRPRPSPAVALQARAARHRNCSWEPSPPRARRYRVVAKPLRRRALPARRPHLPRRPAPPRPHEGAGGPATSSGGGEEEGEGWGGARGPPG
jgi:hypothetical protein